MSGKEAKPFGAKEFRAELVKIMPGYSWTVHKATVEGYLTATGTTSAGFNRLSTCRIERLERDGVIEYESKSAGFGRRAPWLHTNTDRTLARSLRGLQEHYASMAATYAGHARALQSARADPVITSKELIERTGGNPGPVDTRFPPEMRHVGGQG